MRQRRVPERRCGPKRPTRRRSQRRQRRMKRRRTPRQQQRRRRQQPKHRRHLQLSQPSAFSDQAVTRTRRSSFELGGWPQRRAWTECASGPLPLPSAGVESPWPGAQAQEGPGHSLLIAKPRLASARRVVAAWQQLAGGHDLEPRLSVLLLLGATRACRRAGKSTS